MKYRLIISSATDAELSRPFAVPVFSPILWPAHLPIPALFIEVELDLAETSKTDGGGGGEGPAPIDPTAGEAT